MNSDDALLVERCLKGEERAYGILLGRYRRVVYSLVYRMVGNAEESQDLAQEAFIRAFRSLSSYDRTRSFSNSRTRCPTCTTWESWTSSSPT